MQATIKQADMGHWEAIITDANGIYVKTLFDGKLQNLLKQVQKVLE